MLSETETKKKKAITPLLTNENFTREIQMNHGKTLPELMNAIIEQQFTYVDIMNYIKAQYHAHWMKLMSSDWFSIFLQYLNLKDIVNLDTAFCNHMGRPTWLNLLKDHTIRYTIEIVDNIGLKKMTDWLISKHIHLDKLYFKYSPRFDSHKVLPDETISRLTRNNPNMKELKIENYSAMFFPCTAMFCTQTESLDMYRVNIPDNGIESMSRTCHQLKHLKLSNFNHDGILELLTTNRCMLSLTLSNYNGRNAIILGEIFDALGLYCPLLQNCHIYDFNGDVTDAQMEIFTKGCPNLKQLRLSLHTKMCHKLLHSLGSYNPALEKLRLLRVGNDNRDNTTLTSEQSQSLQCLSNGCLLLKEIDLCNFKVSTSDFIYLVNHSIHLEKLFFDTCNICDDGIIINKEADKLKYLKLLRLTHNLKITDESIINLVKGCHNLKNIRIDYCSKLTDISLFNIAANCPNLESVYLYFDDDKITKSGLKELLKKCSKLVDIDNTGNVNIPHKIENELNKRKQALASK